MSSLRNLKIGKLINCRLSLDGRSRPAVVRKTANRIDNYIEVEIVTPKLYAKQIYLLRDDLKAEPADVIIKHKGYTLDD